MEDINEHSGHLRYLSKMLKWKKSNKFYAQKLGVSLEEVERLLRILRSEKTKYIPITSKEGDISRREDIEKGTLESVRETMFEPKDHRELAELHNIDLTKFQITNYWSKLKPSGAFTSSVFCKRKTAENITPEDFEKLFKDYKSSYVPVKAATHDSMHKETVDMELSIADYHLAKKYVGEKNPTLEDKANIYFDIAQSLTTKATNTYNLDTIIFPISNDFFHTDNYWNSSTKLTPQDVIAEYDEEYIVGYDLLVRTISMLKSNCKYVLVVLVQGNHDKTKSFYLAHGLDMYFREDKSINFLRGTEPTKSVKTGVTFIGYHHGNCKIEELPLIFATNPTSSKAFGDSVYREVHTGDKHHYMAKEIKGVRIQQMPSLTGNDKWHRENNYVNNIRAALALFYHPEKGKIGEIEERI